MKKGILLVTLRDGQWILQVRKADGNVVDALNAINPESYLEYNEQPCLYKYKAKRKVFEHLQPEGSRDPVSFAKPETPTPSSKPKLPEKEQSKTESLSSSKKTQKHSDHTSSTGGNASKSPTKPANMKGTNLFGNHKDWRKITKDSTSWLRLPADTQILLKENKLGGGQYGTDNYSLKLNKLVHFPEFEVSHSKGKDAPKAEFFRTPYSPKDFPRDSRDKKQLFHLELKFDFKRRNDHKDPNQSLIKSINQKQERLIADSPLATSSTKLAIDWRLIIGLGGESVYERSMTLHHVYGIPYIPASTIKGVLRSYLIKHFWGMEPQAESKALKDPLFVYLFGADSNGWQNKARKGAVSFFDAFPATAPRIKADIMNPHYPDYYSKGQAPTDFQSPNPIAFYTVDSTDAAGDPLKFSFYFGIAKNLVITEDKERDTQDNARDTQYEALTVSPTLQVPISDHWKPVIQALAESQRPTTLLNLLSQLLTDALTQHGIGAKTAVGYGYLRQSDIT